MKNFLHKINWKKVIRWLILLIIIVAAAVILLNRFGKTKKDNMATAVVTAAVEKRDIKTVLSSSGTIQPLNTYDVTSLVEGEVISADFEEGDQVKKGDVLYRIATNSLDTKINSAETNLERAEKNYEKAKKNYQKAVDKFNDKEKDLRDLKLTADASGVVTKVYVKEGSTLQQGTQTADVYDGSYMLLSVPFNSSEVKSSWKGKGAIVEVVDFGQSLSGTVTEVGVVESVLSGNRVVKYVTIKVKNPGGITEQTKATASVGAVACNSEGGFTAFEQGTMTSNLSGKLEKLYIKENDIVKKGDIIGTFSKEDINNQLESLQTSVDNAKDSMDNAKNSIDDAKTALNDEKDSLTDYQITSPISGQVIRKDKLTGDTIKNSAQTSALCVIYDLSAVTFEMFIDELDVMKVKTGQKVSVTADALDGQLFEGVITNVSLESTSSGGVTQYPVTVRINETGQLLPGMNVTGEIAVEEVKDVLAVPVDALVRGDVVYVRNSGEPEATVGAEKAPGGTVKSTVPDGFQEVTVKTGLTDGDYIEIISGLSGNEEVYVSRNSSSSSEWMPFGMGGMSGAEGGMSRSFSNGPTTERAGDSSDRRQQE